MVDIIRQGAEEGLRLLNERQGLDLGVDLTKPLPDLPEKNLPEDETFLGFNVVGPVTRSRIKQQREELNMKRLSRMFELSDRVIKTAQTLPDERRKQFLNKVLPSMEKVFPGSSDQIKIFSDDKGGYFNLLESISDPQARAQLEAFGRAGDFSGALTHLKTLSSKGSSEFERGIETLLTVGDITPEEARKRLDKRSQVLAGEGIRAGQERSLDLRETKHERDFTAKLRKEANEGVEHFSNMNSSISDALAALDSGDNALADTLLAQVLSQVNDTDIRALQMFQQFDKSYGNVAERTINSITRFIKGDRSESEKAMIRETLENFRDSHVRPGVNRIKTQYRNMALEESVDAFKVVPPQTPEEIRDFPGISRDEKIRLLRIYFPERFQ